MAGPATDAKGREETMPVYEYVCQDCGAPSEVRATVDEYSRGLQVRCRECGSERLDRVFSSVAVNSGSPPPSCCGSGGDPCRCRS
ncbi:MAG: hypothetical protein D6718_03780 [Acidobacteria bacterium]|nr:MAG: hypothetical protein D6718_03780 [Acidobacteriota bacterium]